LSDQISTCLEDAFQLPNAAATADTRDAASSHKSGHAPALPRLDRARNQLKATSKQIEGAVVSVCDSFQTILERVRGTTDRTKSLLAGEECGSSGKQSFEELVDICSNTLTSVLAAIEEANAVSVRTVERIRGMEDASQKISAALAKMEQIAQENRLLAMNARIESAHAGKLGAGFAVVAVEVASQSDKTMTLTSEVNDLVGSLRSLANSTKQDMERMHEKDQQRLVSSRKEVDESLGMLRATHEEMKEALADITDESALLATDIGKAVRSLQFQDRVNQQIDHVISDVNAVHALLSGNGKDFDVIDAGGHNLTMHEEREVAGIADRESPEGEIELF